MFADLLNSSYFALFLIVALGFMLGRIKIKGLSLDVSAVIFIALLFGHFGVIIPKELGNFGLVLFIFTIGIQAGPGFFDSFRSKGKTLIIITHDERIALQADRVISIEDISPKVIADQIDAVFEDIEVDAVKVGMLSTPECMEAVAGKLRQYRPRHVVIDPVMYAKNGCPLMQESAISSLIRTVVPLATLLTPNIPEAEVLSGMEIHTPEDMERAAERIYETYGCAVLCKGGHSIQDANDLLFDGRERTWFQGKRIENPNTHGTGCTLSSAIASNLAKGYDLDTAVERAKAYLSGALAAMLDLGAGQGPMDHLFDLKGEYVR